MTSSANRLIQAAAGAAGDRPDENFGDVVLLLDGDGTAGDSNSYYSDESSNVRAVTAVNNPRQGSFTPYGKRWSVYYDGSSSHAFTGGSQYEANTSGFTVSFWANGLGNGTRVFVAKGTTSNPGSSSWWLETVSGRMSFYISNGSGYVVCTDTVGWAAYEGWVHVAGVIDSNMAKLYINGQLKDSQVVTVTNSTGTVPVYIGGYGTSFPFEGYISNVRIHQSALYSGTSFTVPTTVRRENATFWANYSATGDYFVNHGGPNVTGTPRVMPYSPVTQYAITSSDEIDITNGGSVYFDGYDGAIDYLSFTASGYSSVTDFTISFWIYSENMATLGGGYPRAFASGSYTGGNNFIIYMRDDDIRLYFGGERIQTPLDKYTWAHISLQRSGGTFTMYKNGVSVGTSVLSNAVNFNTTNSIGSEVGSWGMKGYIAGFRLTTNGSTPVTVPTGPLTEVTDTQLLMNFKDAGIYDKSGMQNLDTLGGVSLGAAPIYGTGSLQFSSTGDYLSIPNKPVFDLNANDFTIECWAKTSSFSSSYNVLVSQWNTSNTAWIFRITSSLVGLYANIGGTQTYTASVANDVNQWDHFAVAREGSSLRFFKNGTLVGTSTISGTIAAASSDITVGILSDLNTTTAHDGYIDDLRITKGVARYTSSFTPPTAIDLSTDTHREYVTLFLDGDGTANAQNGTFTDSSSNNFTVTETGAVVQGVFSPYGDNWSNYLDGTGSNIAIAETGSEFEFGTGDFTVECFFYEHSQMNSFVMIGSTIGANHYFGYGTVGSGGMTMYAGSAGTDIYSGPSNNPQPGQWNHLVWQRSSGNAQMYLNGTRVYDAAYTANFSGTITGFRIGRSDSYNSNYWAHGYVSNFRITKGSAVYSGASFTVPSSQLSNVANTSLLTCQSNRFVDENNNRTVTLTGTPQVARFSPFESDKPYDITTGGGSANFADNYYLTIADDPGLDISGGMTAECWVYVTDMPDNNIGVTGQGYFINRWTASGNQRSWMIVYGNNGDIALYSSANGGSSYITTFAGAGTIATHRWIHVAVSWDGSNQRLFIDGDLKAATANASGPFSTPASGFTVSAINTTLTGSNHRHYIADVRYFTGAAIYTASFTPPTAPLSATVGANTAAVLLNFQDSAIPDLSGLNNLETFGNAKISGTDPTKYGSNAIAFDGTSGYLKTYDNEAIELGNHDFTIEFWVYFNTVNDSTVRYLFDWRTASDTTNSFLAQEASNNWTYWNAVGTSVSSGFTNSTFSANTWHHVAIAREGSSIYFFADGTKTSGAISDTTTYDSGTLVIGSRYNGQDYLDGHIDDLRITRGVARYTASFTPPTKALPKF